MYVDAIVSCPLQPSIVRKFKLLRKAGSLAEFFGVDISYSVYTGVSFMPKSAAFKKALLDSGFHEIQAYTDLTEEGTRYIHSTGTKVEISRRGKFLPKVNILISGDRSDVEATAQDLEKVVKSTTPYILNEVRK